MFNSIVINNTLTLQQQVKKLEHLMLYLINEQMKIELRKINFPVKFQSATFKLNNIIYTKKEFTSKRHRLLYALIKVQLLKKKVPKYVEQAKKNNLRIKFFYITHSKKIIVVYEKLS